MGDENLIGFSNQYMARSPSRDYTIGYHSYRSIKSLFQGEIKSKEFVFPKVHWFKDTEILTARDKEGTTDGMFLAVKGGHNAESHNHNDVGSFIVYFDGKPLIIDAGVETYTKKTFSRKRYDIWTMQSCYHTLPTINGCDQKEGRRYMAADVNFNHSGDKTTLSMQLKGAYPEESKIDSYIREIVFEHGKSLVIHEKYKLSQLNQSGSPFIFNALCVNKPVVDGSVIKLNESVEMIFDNIFDFSFDEIELTDQRIRRDWNQDYLYRIRLTEKEIKTENDITIVIKKA